MTSQKFNKEDLKGYEEVKIWLRTVSDSTKSSYLGALKKFCSFAEKNPHELIMDRAEENNISDPSKRNRTKSLVLDFRKYLEKKGFAPSSINTYDGAVRGFYSSILGREGMVNVGNYEHRNKTLRKDLVPTLDELKDMLEVCSLREKVRIIFLAQTGMRVSDALKLKVGNVKRELDRGETPLAIRYVPEKEGKVVGERITFLGSDGVKLLRRYLNWREEEGEDLTEDSPLLQGQLGSDKTISRQKFSKMLKKIAKKAGLNGNEKYGRMRAHGLRKFFVTQLTNHGVEDKIVNFFIGHKIPDVDEVYWRRRDERLREIYAERENHLNPLSQGRKFDLDKMKDMKAKIKQLEERIKELEESNGNQDCEAEVVDSEEEVVKFAQRGFDCQPMGNGKWLMKKTN